MILTNNRYSGSVQIKLQIITPSVLLLAETRARCCMHLVLFLVAWPLTNHVFKVKSAFLGVYPDIMFLSSQNLCLFSCQFNRLNHQIHQKKVEEVAQPSTGTSWLGSDHSTRAEEIHKLLVQTHNASESLYSALTYRHFHSHAIDPKHVCA